MLPALRLLLQSNPGVTPTQIYQALEISAAAMDHDSQ